jgi:hypothetical protein
MMCTVVVANVLRSTNGVLHTPRGGDALHGMAASTISGGMLLSIIQDTDGVYRW